MGHGSHSKLLVYQMVNIPAPWFASGYELLVVYAGFLVDAWFLPSNRLLSHNPKSGSTIVCAPWFECFPSSPVKATARWKDPMFRSGSAPNRKPWIYHDISICVFDGPWTKEKWSSFPIQSNPFEIHEKINQNTSKPGFSPFLYKHKIHNSQSAISRAKKKQFGNDFD